MAYLPDLAQRRPRLTNAQTRIRIGSTKKRATSADKPAVITEAVEFWQLAGAAANVVMQLGWTEVAYGVMESKVESGSLMKHPWKRARTTTQYLSVAILGTEEERIALRKAIDSAHRHVKSDADSPVKYNAFNRELQLWVAACLYVGLEDTHQLLHGLMSEDDAELFYQTGKVLGTTLQVTDEMWPATRKDFDVYWNTACERVVIDDRTHAYLNDLVDLKMINPFIRLPFKHMLRFLTVGFLPPIYQEQLGLVWTDRQRRSFEALFRFVSTTNRFLPAWLRRGGANAAMVDFRWRRSHDKALI
ncbi:MAG: oxygenase MpaB family protein [Gordonia sp. (in: high G+C Gram-positive bacteria)]